MNFDLTEEQQMLQDTLRRFLADRYDTGVRNAILESDLGYSPDIWRQLAELGVIGALFTEEQGGFGGSGFDIATVFEELGRAGVVEPVLDTAIIGGGLIASLGDDAQIPLVEAVIAGEIQLALAHGEASARYDLEHVATRAEERDGEILLTGRKAVVVNAEAADYLIVSARESGPVGSREGISLFVVPRDAEGVSLLGYPLVGGGRAAEVVLEGVRLPATARLGAVGAGYDALHERLAAAHVALSAEALGAMESATALTRDYLMTRKQFGRAIGTFQALQHRFADLLVEMEQARSAVILAAGHLEDSAPARDLNTAAARNLIGRVGRLVAEDTIQLHGGIAMTQEYELAHIAKRILMTDHRFGDADYHLERFVALSGAAA
ncbi:acyl-CoA dehydrogenase family protein [Ruegeria pomeroyi]|uniref:Acyl-CoA dehydrogenase family protein n=1 Tax=Ruegeria pomeroyi TaxID=89184 RepID=A0A9Q3WL57_9RHOB|nr:acyl-CoA dehydrogenase [Ruegeria pomeroyi]MCE8520846.1 acyl-CoA dehydrogenase family protein [Ruegeria pomeroyi]MCE8537918.1 acyl-CoA dehydrogenase family protein [Ruegeria pomeroyi]